MLMDALLVPRIYIVCGHTDMRKSIDGLAAIVQQQFKMNPCTQSLFLFCGRRRDRLAGRPARTPGNRHPPLHPLPGDPARLCRSPARGCRRSTPHRGPALRLGDGRGTGRLPLPGRPPSPGPAAAAGFFRKNGNHYHQKKITQFLKFTAHPKKISPLFRKKFVASARRW